MLITVDAQGGRSAFTFSNLKENVGVADNQFVFKMPRNVDVVDRRRPIACSADSRPKRWARRTCHRRHAFRMHHERRPARRAARRGAPGLRRCGRRVHARGSARSRQHQRANRVAARQAARVAGPFHARSPPRRERPARGGGHGIQARRRAESRQPRHRRTSSSKRRTSCAHKWWSIGTARPSSRRSSSA